MRLLIDRGVNLCFRKLRHEMKLTAFGLTMIEVAQKRVWGRGSPISAEENGMSARTENARSSAHMPVLLERFYCKKLEGRDLGNALRASTIRIAHRNGRANACKPFVNVDAEN